MGFFTKKKKKLSAFEWYSLCGKVNFNAIHPIYITNKCLAQILCKSSENVLF